MLIEIAGRLNALLRDTGDQNKHRPVSVGLLVAGARYIRQKQAIDAEFRFAA